MKYLILILNYWIHGTTIFCIVGTTISVSSTFTSAPCKIVVSDSNFPLKTIFCIEGSNPVLSLTSFFKVETESLNRICIVIFFPVISLINTSSPPTKSIKAITSG